jgi:hypothetical protein
MIGFLGFDSRQGLGIFLFTTASRTALGPSQPPIQWVQGPLSVGVKRPGREADHSSPSSAEVKEWLELYIHSPNTPSWLGAYLKHWDNFSFTFKNWVHPVKVRLEFRLGAFNRRFLPRIKVKVKLSLCFNWAPRHEDVLGDLFPFQNFSTSSIQIWSSNHNLWTLARDSVKGVI